VFDGVLHPGTFGVEERCAKVDSRKNSGQKHRGLATALLDIEPRLRKVKGFKHLPKLRQAIQRELKIDVEQLIDEMAKNITSDSSHPYA
jgi:hypothetical protein